MHIINSIGIDHNYPILYLIITLYHAECTKTVTKPKKEKNFFKIFSTQQPLNLGEKAILLLLLQKNAGLSRNILRILKNMI